MSNETGNEAKSAAAELVPAPEDAANAAWLREHAPTLAKWLKVLFWLSIASLICETLHNDTLFKLPAGATAASAILTGATCFITLLQLYAAWNLRRTERKFRGLAIVYGISFVLSAADVMAFRGAAPAAVASDPAQSGGILWLAVASLVAAMCFTLLTYYLEMTALHHVTGYVEQELAEKWCRLRNWLMGLTAAAMGLTLLTILTVSNNPLSLFGGGAAFLAVLAMAVSLGAIVCLIVRPVYLYRTAKRFQMAMERE